MQVEILGVSLPWKSIFSHEDSGSSFIERLNGHSKEMSPFLTETDTNPLAGAITNYREPPSFQSESSANSLVDLLTGEVALPNSITQPVAETVVHEGSDILNFLDDVVTKPVSDENNHSKIVSSQGPTDNGSQQYIKLFKLLAGPHWVCLLLNQY